MNHKNATKKWHIQRNYSKIRFLNPRILILTIVIIAVTWLESCKKYLDKKPDNSISVPTSIEELQALLDDAELMNLQRTPSLVESAADDYFLTSSSFNSLREFERQLYIWAPFEYKFGNDWNYSYLPIYNANFCLESIDKIVPTAQNEQAWKNVKGSALFFRAFYFLNLAWTYAKAYNENTAAHELGIVLRLSSDFNIKSVRATIEETYQRITDDTKEALTLLPDNPLHVLRPSKAAAYGLLARAYLSMRSYDSAFKYADLCLGIKSSLMNYNLDPDVIGGDVPFKQFNAETIFYTEMNENVFNHSIYYAFIDTLLYEKYDSNDLRKEAFFMANDNYYQFKGNYTQSENLFFTGLAADEIYLIRAECLARIADSNKDAALADLNTLLSNRYISGTFIPIDAANNDELIDLILLERRKELVMRGLRWMDIKRQNLDGRSIILKREIDGQVHTLSVNSNMYALPLPMDIVDQGVQQNPL